jgi:hypothetical protein
MICKGILTIGALVRFEHASDGTPQLLIHAFSPGLSPNGVAYKLVWTGHEAEAFYTLNEHRLHMGASISATLINPQPLIKGGQMYLFASVLGIEIVNRDGGPVDKAGAYYTPRPVVQAQGLTA